MPREGGVSSFEGHSTAYFRVWDVPMVGSTRSALMVSLIEESEKKNQQCVAIHGWGPSVRSCCALRGV